MDSLIVFPILLFSVVVHEVSHGLMALKLGDPTARDAGRLTLNPIPHIDLLGSIIVPLLSYVSAGTVFLAWAKPVPVNPMNFRNFRRDDIFVSVVGPLSNLLVAGACAVMYILTVKILGSVDMMTEGFERSFATFLMSMFLSGITLNIFLAVFNLIPIPPLDGSHVLASLLPAEVGIRYRRIGFLGILLVVVLMRLDPFRDVVFSIVKALLVPYRQLLDVFL